MRTSTKILLATAALSLCGSAAFAFPAVHHLAIRLPGGGTEQISYTGDTAPRVTIVPAAAFLPETIGVPVFAPVFTSDAGFWSPFVRMDRISAEMDRMAGVMDRQMAVAMRDLQAAAPNGFHQWSVGSLPSGVESYSVSSLSNGNTMCTREVQVIGMGNGAKPKVISHSSGNCSGMQSFANPSRDNAQMLKTGTRLPVEIIPSRQHI